jgi:hypothetical protein
MTLAPGLVGPMVRTNPGSMAEAGGTGQDGRSASMQGALVRGPVREPVVGSAGQ